jgi:hypothetical protein
MGGPTTIVSGYGFAASGGGSVPEASAARRSK